MSKFANLSSIGLFLSLSVALIPACNSGTSSDSGVTDGGPDSGLLPDSGLDDGGVPDSGIPDSGIPDDGGSGDGGPDAGDNDAGPDGGMPDAGPVVPSLDFIPTPPADLVLATGISANGAIAALWDRSTTGVYYYKTDTKELNLVTSTMNSDAAIYRFSGDGTRVAGVYSLPFTAGLWNASSDWVILGSPFDGGCDPFVSGAFGINFDGTVAVGNVWEGCFTDAFLWTGVGDGGTFTLLEKLGSATGADRASVVSGDGKVAAGFVQTAVNDRSPAIWHADGTGFMLDSSQYAPGEVLAINADGSMVAGIYNLSGFYWTQDAGMVDIGKLPGALPTDNTWPNAIAANGQLLFGGSGDPAGIPQAVVWTEDGGLRPIQDIAVAQGITLPGTFVLSSIVGASADGTTLLGVAVDDTYAQEPFILRLPVSAYGIGP
jgi:hypothetical protein